MPCDIQAGLDQAKCFQQLNPRQLQMIKTYLVCQISQEILGTPDCDPETLLALAICFDALSDKALIELETSLLCQGLVNGVFT